MKKRPRAGGGRRRKATAAARLRPFWIPLVLALALLGSLAAFVVAWPGFEPRTVAVSGNRVVSRGDIVAAAGIAPHINMWLQNGAAIAARVRAIPYIATAAVHRIPPATVSIAVTERAPFAVARSGAKSAIVDRDLRVLQTVPSAGQTALPVFVLPPSSALIPGAFLTQAPAIALRDDYDAMIAANVIPLSVRLDKYGGVIATVRGGIEILFGDGEGADFAKKLALVDPILAQVVHKERRVAAVDLRAAGTPVVVYR